jgi:glycosyltransferase involved in cell wall biosynthesis
MAPPTPKVSVVIPTYNRAEFVPVAIKSVLDQTFKDFEIIVVDDGSDDNTEEVVASLTDHRIKYIRHATNKRISGARNTGIKNSAADYIAFLDDDDRWLPEKLEKQVALLDRCSATTGGVYTGFFVVERSSGKLLETFCPGKRGNVYNDLLRKNCIRTASTVMLRKRCLAEAGLFDESIAYGEEYDLWLRVSRKFLFECISEPLVVYSVHGSNTSRNYQHIISGKEAQLEKHLPLLRLNPKAYSQRLLQLGEIYCSIGNLTNGRAAFSTGIKLDPFEVRHYYNLVLSFAGRDHYNKWKLANAKRLVKLRAHARAVLGKLAFKKRSDSC